MSVVAAARASAAVTPKSSTTVTKARASKISQAPKA